MERIPIRITALLVMTTLAACDFLDIDTPGIVNRDKMFENEQGFIDAMNGVYASMADADLYGEQLSFGFVDEIAQLYYNCLLYTSPSPRDRTRSRMPSSA